MINWDSLLLVATVSIFATVILVSVFSLGMRLLTNARNIFDNTKKGEPVKPTEVLNRSFAYVCFTICGAAVIYGIYLIVPYFHLAK